jgi:prepilin-type N-terminal cleavage/methylation domain-containing protein
MPSTPYRQRLILQLLTKSNSIKATQGQGFTLIELLVVIVILGVLGAVGYGAYINQLQRANANSAQVAAVAAAKNCAALLATGDQSAYVAGVDPTQITINFGATTSCVLGTTFNATAGTGANLGTGGATITAQGAVTPL